MQHLFWDRGSTVDQDHLFFCIFVYLVKFSHYPPTIQILDWPGKSKNESTPISSPRDATPARTVSGKVKKLPQRSKKPTHPWESFQQNIPPPSAFFPIIENILHHLSTRARKNWQLTRSRKKFPKIYSQIFASGIYLQSWETLLRFCPFLNKFWFQLQPYFSFTAF